MKRMKKTRPGTVANKIRNEPDVSKKLLLAFHGEEKPRLEVLARTFLSLPDAMNTTKAPQEFRSELFNEVSSELFGEFLNALVARDAPAVEAVASFLRAEPRTDKDVADIVRTKVLSLKALLNPDDPLMDSRELANKIAYKNGNLDVLRRVAEDVQFPLRKKHGGNRRPNDK